MNLDTIVSFSVIAAVIYYWFKDKGLFGLRGDPTEHEDDAEPVVATVKNKPRLRGFRLRSRRVNVQNPVNAGSGHQNAEPNPVNVLNVQNVQGGIASKDESTATHASSNNTFTLTPTELVQLTTAIQHRANGATVEESIYQGFGYKKGGSEGYLRAKALFDAATSAGAAPAAPTASASTRGRRLAAR